MPQEHYVLRCFSCGTFQAHIVKKAKKWECKMCGAKQSVKRNYGKGSGKDCRNQVMKLNECRYMSGSNPNENEEITHEMTENDLLESEQIEMELKQNKPFTSKWEKYLEIPEPESEDDDTCDLGFEMGEIIQKNKKRVKSTFENFSNKKICRDTTNETSPPVTKSHLLTSPHNDKNYDSYKTSEKSIPNQTKTNIKISKYDKYVDEKEEEEEEKQENAQNLTQFKKYSNIFDSNTDDLDKILSFE